MQPTAVPFTCTTAEIEQFHDKGFLGPYRLLPPEAIAPILERIETEVLPMEGPWRENTKQLRHLDSKAVYDLCAHESILSRIFSLWGEDTVIWRSHFYFKEPAGKAVPWHQDAQFWQLDPPLNLTAWLALDHVNERNGCVQLIPGTHTRLVPHVEAGAKHHFDRMADPEFVDTREAVKMVLKPGEFFLFNERILHYSAPNTSTHTRKCLITRYSKPFVKIPPLFSDHRLLLVGGEDRYGINRYAPAPS